MSSFNYWLIVLLLSMLKPRVARKLCTMQPLFWFMAVHVSVARRIISCLKSLNRLMIKLWQRWKNIYPNLDLDVVNVIVYVNVNTKLRTIIHYIISLLLKWPPPPLWHWQNRYAAPGAPARGRTTKIVVERILMLSIFMWYMVAYFLS